jgi:hypothetical protein
MYTVFVLVDEISCTSMSHQKVDKIYLARKQFIGCSCGPENKSLISIKFGGIVES